MVIVNKEALFGTGFRLRILSVGASVALRWQRSAYLMVKQEEINRDTNSARAAKVSIIRLTHNSCTALKTLSLELLYRADTNVRATAVMLTVIWNWQNN